MELTLIPLAVVLLLLSGASSRTPLAEGPSVSTGLIRLWLTGDKRQSAARLSVKNTASARSFVTADRELRAAYESSQVATAQRARTEVQRRRHSLLRGRFGVASAAYLATAPPLA